MEAASDQVDLNILSGREGPSSNMTYELKTTTKRLIYNRQTNEKSPTETGDIAGGFTDGNKIIFEVSTKHCIDPHSVYIKGNFRPRRADGSAFANNAFPRLKGSVSRAFDNVKVSFGETEIDNLQKFNLWSDIHDNCCLSGDYLLSQAQSELLDDRKVDKDVTAAAAAVNDNPAVAVFANPNAPADLAAAAVAIGTGVRAGLNALVPKIYPPKYETKEASDWILNGREFIYPLSKYVGIFNQPKYLPIDAMGTLKVEITVAKGSECLVFGTAPADSRLEFTNMRICYDTVEFEPTMMVEIKDKIAKGGFFMDFRSYRVKTENTAADTFTISDKFPATDVCSLYAVMQRNNYADAATKAANDKFNYLSGRDAANEGTGAAQHPSWQFQVGQDVFPKKEVETFTQARAELDKAMAHFANIQRGNVPYSEFCASKYVIGVNLENDPVSSYTGRSTKQSQADLNLKNLSAYAKTVSLFMLYTKAINILPSGVVVYK